MDEPPSYYRRFSLQREAFAQKDLVSEKEKRWPKTPALTNESLVKGGGLSEVSFFPLTSNSIGAIRVMALVKKARKRSLARPM